MSNTEFEWRVIYLILGAFATIVGTLAIITFAALL